MTDRCVGNTGRRASGMFLGQGGWLTDKSEWCKESAAAFATRSCPVAQTFHEGHRRLG